MCSGSKRVTKRYGNFTALDKVDITVAKGAIYGLVGDNGAGKTTFLKLLSGHIYADEGELKLFGCHRLKDMEEQRKRTGVVIEAPGFYPQISVEKNLEYYRILKGVSGKRAVDEVLELVGLADKRKKRCRDLSLGMKQRLGLAIALIGEPELLILDEPINGLDPSGIIEIRNLMQKLNREKNITIILSSHILSELEQLATVYGFLTDGKLAEQVTAEEIKEKCSDYIEISVSDPERYTAVLEKKFHTERYKVLPDKTIHIMDPMMDIGAYSRLAGEYHMDISKLERRQVTLEEYYMDLKNGGQRHA
ncbi:MAG: ABC transporter ATP-binding protein [Blautia marasmi]